jgi:hypothetical protein
VTLLKGILARPGSAHRVLEPLQPSLRPGIVGHLLRLIAALPAWKLTNEANRVRFELKYRIGE